MDETDEKLKRIKSYQIQRSRSERLPIRLVDRYCRGIEGGAVYNLPSSPNEDLQFVFPSSLKLTNDGGLSGLLKRATELGTLMPVGSTNIIDFLKNKNTDIAFFSVDWSQDWLKILNEQELNLVYPSLNVVIVVIMHC